MEMLNIVKNIPNKLKKNMDKFFSDRFTKYIIDYKPEGENLRIITNFGDSRIVKNTPSNQAKLNKVVIKSKLDILGRIDEYEKSSHERLMVLMFNIMLLGVSGMLVPFTFFIGSYIIFMLSIFLFSFLSLATSLILIDYYLLVEEISSLKNVTGYKKENEFNIPKLKDIISEIK